MQSLNYPQLKSQFQQADCAPKCRLAPTAERQRFYSKMLPGAGEEKYHLTDGANSPDALRQQWISWKKLWDSRSGVAKQLDWLLLLLPLENAVISTHNSNNNTLMMNLGAQSPFFFPYLLYLSLSPTN